MLVSNDKKYSNGMSAEYMRNYMREYNKKRRQDLAIRLRHNEDNNKYNKKKQLLCLWLLGFKDL
jgi:hypothetical protein